MTMDELQKIVWQQNELQHIVVTNGEYLGKDRDYEVLGPVRRSGALYDQCQGPDDLKKAALQQYPGAVDAIIMFHQFDGDCSYGEINACGHGCEGTAVMFKSS